MSLHYKKGISEQELYRCYCNFLKWIGVPLLYSGFVTGPMLYPNSNHAWTAYGFVPCFLCTDILTILYFALFYILHFSIPHINSKIPNYFIYFIFLVGGVSSPIICCKFWIDLNELYDVAKADDILGNFVLPLMGAFFGEYCVGSYLVWKKRNKEKAKAEALKEMEDLNP